MENRPLFGTRTPSERGRFQSKALSLVCVPQAPWVRLTLYSGATGGRDSAYLPDCID